MFIVFPGAAPRSTGALELALRPRYEVLEGRLGDKRTYYRYGCAFQVDNRTVYMSGATGLISTINFGRHVIVVGRPSLFRKSKFVGLVVKVEETGATARAPQVPVSAFAVALSTLAILFGLTWHDVTELLVGVVGCAAFIPMLVVAVMDGAGAREALKGRHEVEL